MLSSVLCFEFFLQNVQIPIMTEIGIRISVYAFGHEAT